MFSYCDCNVLIRKSIYELIVAIIIVELSSKMFCGINLRAIAQKLFMNLICNMCLVIAVLKLLPGANELTQSSSEQVDDYPGHSEWYFLQ